MKPRFSRPFVHLLLLLPVATACVYAESRWTAVGLSAESPQVLPVRIEPEAFGYKKMSPRWELNLPKAWSTGHVYELVVQARAPAGEAVLKVALVDDESKTVFRCGPVLSAETETYTAPFTVPKDLPKGSLRVCLVYGYGDEEIEVLDVRINDLGSDKPLNAYARTGRWYAGQESDAAWRKKAKAMIAANRMGTFSVEVVDAQGKPVEDARVIIQQQSHAYRFGVAVNSTLWRYFKPNAESDGALLSELQYYRETSGRNELTFAERKAEIATYFETLKTDFNYVVFENAMKWQAWSGEWGGFYRNETFELIDWLHANNIEVKGHALVWPGWRHSPAFAKKMADRPDDLNRLVHAHITEMGNAMNGKVVAFDVMNEAFNNHDYMDVMGRDVMADWYRRARSVLPDAQLNLNDFLLMANGGQWTEKLDFYDRLIGGLLEDGAPLEGIGFQSHFRHTHLTAPERIWELCDRFGRYDLPLVSSEFDLDLADEQLQAEYMHDFMMAWFAHPDTQALVQWGFWQGSHWLPHAGLYGVDWRIKPNAKVYRDLVYNQWWSGWEEAQTDTAGLVKLRGFLGGYRISVYAGGRETVLENVELNKNGTVLSIRL